MRTIAHISDLHFGRIDEDVVHGLLADLALVAPSLVVISGDLVQRAGHRHFRAARDFLGRLRTPYLVVPGNHDIPAYDLLARFTAPFRRYQHYISGNLSPVYIDDRIAVLGLNSARAMVFDFSHGRINLQQLDRVREVFGPLPASTFKVLVTHHPFLPPPDAPGTRLIGRAHLALPFLAETGVDLLLAGHLHKSYIGDIAGHHHHVERSILVAQASTATSTRLRNEPNSYNLITVAMPLVRFEARVWNGSLFEVHDSDTYIRNGYRWEPTVTTGPTASALSGPAASS